MALFETKNVTLALDKLIIEEYSDRFWSDVEPYIIPVFYKIDGEGYEAVLRILNTKPARPDTSEVTQPGSIQFNVDSLQEEGYVGPEQDNPFIHIPEGDLLGRGSFDSGDEVDISDVFFTTNLKPIPFKIDVLGIFDADRILDLLTDLFVNDSDLNNAFNTVFTALNNALSTLIGLDETFESCPPIIESEEEFINNIEAQFNCLIPGTIGGIFVALENDEFDEDLAKTLQSSIVDEVEQTINDTINSIALNNPIPDPEDYLDPDAPEDVKSDMTWPVVSEILLSLGVLAAGILSFNPILVVYEVFLLLSWAFGGPDDLIGQHQVTYSHLDLDNPSQDFEETLIGDDNEWTLTGSFTVN